VKSYTPYAWGVEITFQNTGSVDEQVEMVTVQGSKLLNTGSRITTVKDDKSIKDLGIIKVTIQHDFIQTEAQAEELAINVLDRSKTSRLDVSLNTRGNIALRLGQKVTAPGQSEGSKLEYMVSRQQVKWMGFLEATVDGKAVV